MKHDKFLINLVDCARESYIKVYSLAMDSDFSDKRKLMRLNHTVQTKYDHSLTYKRKFKLLIYVTALIYDNEIISDSLLCYNLNMLILINKRKLYKPHKFIQNITSLKLNSLVPGLKRDQLDNIINKLLRGVKC